MKIWQRIKNLWQLSGEDYYPIPEDFKTGITIKELHRPAQIVSMKDPKDKFLTEENEL